ncbi:MAG: hypothetical protein N6V49_02940 [Serratia symbiotica]|nr:hypothetical protein [Serratia symbiotica]
MMGIGGNDKTLLPNLTLESLSDACCYARESDKLGGYIPQITGSCIQTARACILKRLIQ